MITPPVARKLCGLAVLAGMSLGFVLGAPDSARAESEPEAPATVELDEPVTPDHHLIPIIYPRFPIFVPGYPIVIIPIFPYPHPCGGYGLLPVPPPPPGQPGLPTPGLPPGPTPTLRPVATPTPGGRAQSAQYRICPQVDARLPQGVKDLALAEPWRFQGYGELRNPSIPYHPLWNDYRTWLSLRDSAQPYSRCNLPLWKAGCP